MTTKTLTRNSLPECTLGRAGHDLFSSRKDLTVIMIPFERFSPFAKAVDDLYKTIEIPFNLIVIEGNAPQSVRSSLEQRQQKYKNMTIIYSNQQTSIGAAINLATPHLKTKYAFIIDNDVHIPRGAMGNLLRGAVENQHGIVYPQNYTVLSSRANEDSKKVQSLGIRTCFLISLETIHKLGKFDETMTPFTTEIDIYMSAEGLGISIFNETATRIELNNENFLEPMDASLHSFQWDEERVLDSLKCLEMKWGIHLQKRYYIEWLKSKKRDLLESRNPLVFLARILAKIRFLYDESSQQRNFRQFLVPQAA